MANEKTLKRESAEMASGTPPGGLGLMGKVSIQQIVVPTDLTPHGRTAVNYGLLMAKCFNAKLSLVYVYDPAYVYAEAEEVIRKLELFCSELRNEYANIEFTCDVGAPNLQIPALAVELRADLMVIARHNYNWLERLVLGAGEEQIMRRTSCPILVVHENGSFED